MNSNFTDPQVLSVNPDQIFPFGNGIVQVLLNTPTLACGKFVLKQGAEGSTDVHEQATEVAFIIKGQVEYQILDYRYVTNAGQAIVIPPKYPHCLKNIGNEEAIIFWFFTPNDHQLPKSS